MRRRYNSRYPAIALATRNGSEYLWNESHMLLSPASLTAMNAADEAYATAALIALLFIMAPPSYG